jgi:hypothetical protein
MSICNSNCVSAIPVAAGGDGCKVTTRSGGVRRLIFAQCDISFTDILDLNEWQTKIAADELHATGEIKGNKPKGSFTKLKTASCLPEQVVSGEKSLQVFDYNADDATFLDYDFWNGIQADHQAMVFGYTDCNDNLYGFIGEFAVEIDDVREDDVKGNTFFDILITWESILMNKPQNIPGLNTVLA